MQQHGIKYFASGPPNTPRPWGWGHKVQKLSEHGHVAYQIKENHNCSNMVANILSADPPDISTNMPCLTPILAGDSSDSRNSSYLIRIRSLKLGYGYSVKVALLLALSILYRFSQKSVICEKLSLNDA